MLKNVLSMSTAYAMRKEVRKRARKYKYGWIVSALVLALITEGMRQFRKSK